MADLNELLAGLLGRSPSNGGLNATNYPNEFVNPNANGGGLRTWELHDNPKNLKEITGYGGKNALPKGRGWWDVMQNLAYPDQQSTELSTGDNIGDFPTMSQSQTPATLHQILSMKHGERVPDNVYEIALQDANARRAQGLSPFKDVWDYPKGLLNR
jgi:hypothetical protein